MKLVHGSPYVIQIFDQFVEEGKFNMVMEHFEHQKYDQFVDKLEIKDIQEIALKCLMGLESMHESAIVHNNIKPSNVLIDP